MRTLLLLAGLSFLQTVPDARLATSKNARVDFIGERVELTVLPGGSIVAGGDTLFDPDRDRQVERPTARLAEWLDGKAGEMKKEFPLGDAGGDGVATEPLLIQADRVAPFSSVEMVLAECRRARIPRTQFAVREKTDELSAAKPRAGHIDAFQRITRSLDDSLDRDEARKDEVQKIETLELVIAVTRPGSRLAIGRDAPWSTRPEDPFRYDPTRRVKFAVGDQETTDLEAVQFILEILLKQTAARHVSIEPRAGVTHGEVIGVIDAVLAAGAKEWSLASRPR